MVDTTSSLLNGIKNLRGQSDAEIDGSTKVYVDYLTDTHSTMLVYNVKSPTFRNLVRDMKYQLERSGQKRGINAVAAAVRPGIISDKLNNAIATGNWGRGRVGITQLLDRTNYLSTISHLRRVQSPLSRTQPNFEARDLHSTHF